jgi:hypothetical protein
VRAKIARNQRWRCTRSSGGQTAVSRFSAATPWGC